jgi:hypothetical protein
MPLATYFNNMWYGSASGTMDGDTPVVEVSADIKGNIAPSMEVQGFIEPYIKGTMGRTQTLIVDGIGSIEQADWKKLGRVALDVSIGATPSAYDISQAVWGAVASQNNVTGTMGEKLNGAGSAGNPWTTDLSSYNTANTAGKILRDAADSAELASIK